jgi:2-aminoadipate transaminase
MSSIFSDRINDTPRSFLREILKVTSDESVISFAGGLPNRKLFPVEAIKNAAVQVLDTDGEDALQYSTTEGYAPLRKWIADRYKKTAGLEVDPDDILITNGSQQGLDLLGKTFVNEKDPVAIEEPGYLGAIQAFSVYRAHFKPIPLNWDGPDPSALEKALKEHVVKLFYTVPNFQNPSGLTHSDDNRAAISSLIKNTNTLLVEDNPYGELRFSGKDRASYRKLIPDNTVLLGSFSKIFVPSFRLGWITARRDLMEKIVVAKQASDLHTNYFGQRVLYQYLKDNDLEAHIKKIREVYARQRNAMVAAVKEYFPASVKYSEPEGGMFMWAALPEGHSAMELFEKAAKEKVIIVPGDPFYVGKSGVGTMRLNFSCVDEKTVTEGVRILGGIIKTMVK